MTSPSRAGVGMDRPMPAFPAWAPPHPSTNSERLRQAGIPHLVHAPAPAARPAPAMPAPPELAGQDGRELRLPRADRLVAEHDPALRGHLAEVAQAQAVAQPPEHHEGDDVAR